MRKTRLFIATNPLYISLAVKIEDGDFEYLTKVMRKKIGDELFVFNGTDGEFCAAISAIEKRNLTIVIKEKIAEQMSASQITLAFAPVKNVRIDFVATKATEMGVGKFAPIITNHSVVDKINEERFAANIKEACEQCERNDMPQILPIKKLEKFLQEMGEWESGEVGEKENSLKNPNSAVHENNSEKIIILCDESGKGVKASTLLPKIFANKNPTQEIIILIGPEGGFSKEEFAMMGKIKNLHSMSLGERILRSDTA
ncbi:MAG: 16S rRNA (uracil(1498)-N(3))-methyltransferase, partial [Rickettsiales bacterium]|nr:16S rRNA (uracil(1498)-N(3))-methyltransferase [Rickettsiales bacterium]